MNRRTAAVAVLPAVLLICGRAGAQSEKTVEELRAENAKLREQVRQLAALLEGTAKPINLGRTSLAAVQVSQVNGGRAQSDPYYGALNLFDNGENLINGINYHSWVGGGPETNWAEIRFDGPVTVTSIEVDGHPAFSARLFPAEGDETQLSGEAGSVTPAKPVGGVTRVRVLLERGQANEIRVMGFPPAGAKFTVGKPRIHYTALTAEFEAQARLEDWKRLFLLAHAKTDEDDKQFVVTYSTPAGLPVFRTTIEKATGKVFVKPLVQLAPISQPEERVGKPAYPNPDIVKKK